MKRLIVFLFIIVSFGSINASEKEYRPGMDVFLFKIDKNNNLIFIGNISDVDGYDNQPSFAPDNQSVLYVSARNNGQTDVYQYDISAKKNKRLTFTQNSEYSPVMNRNNGSFYAVREGGEPYQSVHLYQYPQPGQKESSSEWAVSSQTPIGYYAFNSDGVAAGWGRWANSIYLFFKDNPYATFVTGHAVPSRPFVIPSTLR